MDGTAQEVEEIKHSNPLEEDQPNEHHQEEEDREEGRRQSIDMLPQFPGDLSHRLSSTSAVAPVLPVQHDEMEMSDASRRVRSHTTVLPRGSLQSETLVSLQSSTSADAGSKGGSIRTKGSVSEPLDRAVFMVQTYPIMQVEGTAFENQIYRRGTLDSMESTLTGRSITSLSIAEGEDIGETSTDLAMALERVRRTGSVVQHAARLKRGCMWEVIITNFLVHQAWQELYRRSRLRKVLETLLLPIILRKRGIKGTISSTLKKLHVHPPVLLRENEGQKPQGSFLIEHSPFFEAFRNPKFCDTLAEVVQRYRFPAGEAIVNAGSPSQDALYILYSGKCDAILPSNEERKVVKRSRVPLGGIFGGLFGGKSVFTETFRAVSQCIVWIISREDFELLFGQYADENMKKVYLDAFKKHQMERLHQCYPMPQSMSRVPIYRHIDRSIEEYVKDFTPLVLTNGDVLFNQGDSPGVVYCLLEGHVARDQIGPDMTYESGTQQIISPNNADNNFALNTRFLLLGEEPHILPGPLKYRCTVVSRAALFYKIEGERFVNALLDDAALFLQVREKLTTQRRLWMKLAPEALSTVPILVGLPFSNLNNIAHAAEPRVVERCVSICEPAQNIREIYILTVGDVRDPRNFNRVPTHPAVVPPSESDDSQEKQVTKGKKEKQVKSRPVPPGKDVKIMNTTYTTDQLSGSRPQNVSAAIEALSSVSPLFNSTRSKWSFLSSIDNDNENTITYPDEHQELSPPLPPNPAKSFLCTIGGGWEGLLLEKWPNGWETTTTVELWAIPMLTIRTELNSTPKLIQSTIISNARDLQMRELGLPAPIVAKLPRLSAYLPPEKRLTKHSLGVEKNPVLEKSVVRRSRKTLGSGFSRELSTATGSKQGRATGDLSGSRLSTLSELSLGSPVEKNKNSEAKPLHLLSPYTSRSVKALPKYGERQIKKEVDVRRASKVTSHVDNANTESFETRKPKAGPPPLLFLRKLAPKEEESPVITPELCAIYAGKEPQKGIIRKPPSPPHPKKQRLLPLSPTQLQRSKEEGSKRNRNVYSDQQSSWPITTGVKKQWFHVVPDFAPLPGTANNQNYISHTPNLVPNSAMMVRIEKGRGEVLTSQATYFASLAQMRRSKENNAASSPSAIAVATTTTTITTTTTKTEAGGVGKSIPTPTRTTSPKMMSRPVPGRHVCLL